MMIIYCRQAAGASKDVKDFGRLLRDLKAGGYVCDVVEDYTGTNCTGSRCKSDKQPKRISVTNDRLIKTVWG
jgi:hypothetical protein